MRILIVEPHPLVAEMMRRVAGGLRHEVVGHAPDGAKAAELVCDLRPDALVLEVVLRGQDGFGVIAAARRWRPQVRCLILSSRCDPHTVHRAEAARVGGFLDKEGCTSGVLRDALRALEAGRTYFSPAFERIRARLRSDPVSFAKLLTRREREVLAHAAQPMTSREIAARLNLSWETVKKHRFSLRRKLDLRNTADLVRYAREQGFLLTCLEDGAATPPASLAGATR